MSLKRRDRNRRGGLPPGVWVAPSRHGKGAYNSYYRERVRLLDGREKVSYIALLGALHSSEWWESYSAARNGQLATDRKDRGAERIRKGTFADVIASYKQTNAYRKGAEGTIRWRNTQLNYIIDTLELGDVPVASLKRVQLQTIIEKRADEAWGAARSLLVMFRQLYDRAIAMELVEANLAKGIPEPKSENAEGRRDWPEPLIEQYQRRHPAGTMARVAIEVFLCTAFRGGDACRVGWKDVVDGVIADFETEKTGKRVNIPLHPDLKAALDVCPVVGKDSWIVGSNGGALNKRSLRRWFRIWCDEAGIPAEFSAHGLRASVCRRLMDLGVAIEDAMAISGHSDRRVFLGYAKKRDERLAAKRAMDVYAAAQKNAG